MGSEVFIAYYMFLLYVVLFVIHVELSGLAKLKGQILSTYCTLMSPI
jgi:hypothetical protein